MEGVLVFVGVAVFTIVFLVILNVVIDHLARLFTDMFGR